ncbi:MAG: hypothetical protein LBF28_01535 [Rickettsiales bacterium]|jgi:hypothetical protein|nr:hypothetical protein [Rickettsiales bacterium]
MKKTSISAVLATIFFALPIGADAAYPAYPSYQQQIPQPAYQQAYRQVQQQVVMQQPAAVMQAGSGIAAAPTRVTGTLPRVGSNSTNAGRQYYQPADYDRLADSGLYIGLSVAYSASVNGSISADYQNEDDSFNAPGAFKSAALNTGTVIPLQLSVGAAINNDVRVDFSYTRYGGIEYPQSVETSNGNGGFVKTQVTGGAVTANATMLNVYYNIDSYTGYLDGGSMRPYIGAGVGISLNTIADYVVFDKTFYSEQEPAGAAAGSLTAVSDIYGYHNGGTSEQLAYMLEGGVTTELDGGIRLDFFARYSGLGQLKTSGSIVVSQTEHLADGAGGEAPAPYDAVHHYKNWYESGSLTTIDVGIRMRLQF